MKSALPSDKIWIWNHLQHTAQGKPHTCGCCNLQCCLLSHIKHAKLFLFLANWNSQQGKHWPKRFEGRYLPTMIGLIPWNMIIAQKECSKPWELVPVLAFTSSGNKLTVRWWRWLHVHTRSVGVLHTSQHWHPEIQWSVLESCPMPTVAKQTRTRTKQRNQAQY